MHAIRKKCPGMDIGYMLFHHDNAHPHRSNETFMTINFLGFPRLAVYFAHASYSPDHAPMDVAIFPKRKGGLRGRRFSKVDELRLAVRSIVSTLEKDWYYLNGLGRLALK